MGLWVLLHTSRLRPLAALGRRSGVERPQPDVGLPPTAMGQGRVETHMGFTSDSWGRGFQEAGDVALPAPVHSTPRHRPVTCLLGQTAEHEAAPILLLFGPPHLGRTAF